jgi:hypothetical protein
MLGDSAFQQAFSKFGPIELARRLGITKTAVYKRRRNLERKLRLPIKGPDHYNSTERPAEYPHRVHLTISNGIVLVGSDAHIWPGPMSTAMRAFIKFCKELEPRAVVLNGDMMDLPRISRWDPIGWEHQPTVQEEIEAAQDQLHQIEMAAGKVPKVWPLGNHDARFETRLATVAPEYAKLTGMHLKDHFPNWAGCWSCWINNDVVVAHQFKTGDHAPFNNVLRSGKTHISGHLHSAKVIPYTDYSGTRYGVDTGCLADVDHIAFVNYTRDAPKNWRSGFCVLTFCKGQMLQPELVLVHDKNHIQFRGEIHAV